MPEQKEKKKQQQIRWNKHVALPVLKVWLLFINCFMNNKYA